MPSFKFPQIRISNLLMAMLCIAILLSWRNDRRKIIAEYDAILNPRPRWGNCQAEGPPDTPGSGDIATAWASKTPDGQREWLIAEYSKPLRPQAVEVHETYNPGAVTKVTGLDEQGMETLLWEGAENLPAGAKRNVSVFPVRVNKRFRRIKIYLDSPNFPGWNEIDAIGVKTASGKHWAVAVESSSSYANTNRYYTFGGYQINR